MILLIHTEAQYFGGAERVLGDFLAEWIPSGAKLVVAAT